MIKKLNGGWRKLYKLDTSCLCFHLVVRQLSESFGDFSASELSNKGFGAFLLNTRLLWLVGVRFGRWWADLDFEFDFSVRIVRNCWVLSFKRNNHYSLYLQVSALLMGMFAFPQICPRCLKRNVFLTPFFNLYYKSNISHITVYTIIYPRDKKKLSQLLSETYFVSSNNCYAHFLYVLVSLDYQEINFHKIRLICGSFFVVFFSCVVLLLLQFTSLENYM